MKSLLLMFMAFFMVMLVLIFHHWALESRATECSALLHGFNDGTIVPLTDDASIEIGACLLQFKQPLGGGE